MSSLFHRAVFSLGNRCQIERETVCSLISFSQRATVCCDWVIYLKSSPYPRFISTDDDERLSRYFLLIHKMVLKTRQDSRSAKRTFWNLIFTASSYDFLCGIVLRWEFELARIWQILAGGHLVTGEKGSETDFFYWKLSHLGFGHSLASIWFWLLAEFFKASLQHLLKLSQSFKALARKFKVSQSIFPKWPEQYFFIFDFEWWWGRYWREWGMMSILKISFSFTIWWQMTRRRRRRKRVKGDDEDGDGDAYLIIVIFLHWHNFWRIKFTPKNANFSR